MRVRVAGSRRETPVCCIVTGFAREGYDVLAPYFARLPVPGRRFLAFSGAGGGC